MKVKRHEVARRLAGGASSAAAAVRSPLDELLARKPEARLDEDLGLSSLERVELLSEMESRLGVDLDEDAFAQIKTVSELTALGAQSGQAASQESLSNWPNSLPARSFRLLMQRALVLPLFRHYIPNTVSGLEDLADLAAPVIFAANHTSNLDTIAIVDALPSQWRRRLAPAMAKDHFRAWFEGRNIAVGIQYWLARSVFNAYPLPQEMSGVKRALHYTGDLVQAGLCPLVYPEGARTPDGTMKKFRPGIGMMALRLQVPVVPVHIQGLFEVYSIHHNWPKRGPVRVTFGPALRFVATDTIESATAAIEAAVRKLST
jgi:long-chain acyl-CoA synthetase